jgi:hypothetical protein
MAKVRGYKRTTKSGKVVEVKGYENTANSAISLAVASDPTRPPMAAKRGSFAGGRNTPGVFGSSQTEAPDKPLSR